MATRIIVIRLFPQETKQGGKMRTLIKKLKENIKSDHSLTRLLVEVGTLLAIARAVWLCGIRH